MIDQAEPDSRQEPAKLADAARQWTRRAVLDIARQAGARVVTRPMFRGRPTLDMTIAQAEPMTGIAAARHLEHAARGLTREYIRCAREDGRTWDQIGMALDLAATAARRGIPLADAAYDEAAGDPDGEYARRYGRTFAWTCPDCQATVRDRGPSSGPADDEQGHEDDCRRLASAIAAWEAQWDEP